MYSVVCWMIFDLFTGTLEGVSGQMDMYSSIQDSDHARGIKQSNTGRVNAKLNSVTISFLQYFTGTGHGRAWAACQFDG